MIREKLRQFLDPIVIAILISAAVTLVGPFDRLDRDLARTVIQYESDIALPHFDLRDTGYIPRDPHGALLKAGLGYSTPLRSLAEAPFPYLIWISASGERARIASCYLFDDSLLGQRNRAAFAAQPWRYQEPSYLCSFLWRYSSDAAVDELFRRDRNFLSFCLLGAFLVTLALLALPETPQGRSTPVPAVGMESAIQAAIVIVKLLMLGGTVWLATITWTIPTSAVLTSFGTGNFLAMAQSIMQLRSLSAVTLLSIGVVYLCRYARRRMAMSGWRSVSGTT